MATEMIRRYSVLSEFSTFQERFEYLQLDGTVGEETFGFERHLNQIFYHSAEWKKVRDAVIVRDDGCDLGILGRTIYGQILIHHMNPITKTDILKRSEFLFDPDFLICTSKTTHNAIHYGDENLLLSEPVSRKKRRYLPVATYIIEEVWNLDSILASVKKMLGIAEEYEHFDADIIMHINTVLSILTQIGLGPDGGFSISDYTAVWSDFMDDDDQLSMVKSYLYLKVRLLFDPPLSSSVADAMNRQISELE